jgi:NAD(P)-dependent dehydrogenase (short-subunit alcohol dehydrogenase family)
MPSVVITGASTGIGWATAKLLPGRGFRVFGSVRKQADADRLRAEFGANFTPLLFDVTDEAAVLAAADKVRAARVTSGEGAGRHAAQSSMASHASWCGALGAAKSS